MKQNFSSSAYWKKPIKIKGKKRGENNAQSSQLKKFIKWVYQKSEKYCDGSDCYGFAAQCLHYSAVI